MKILKIINLILRIRIKIDIKIMNDTNYGNTCYGGVQNNYGTTVGQGPASDEKKKEEDTPKVQNSPSILISRKLHEIVFTLKQSGKQGKEMLAPYAAAVLIGYAPQLTCEGFNAEYDTNVTISTFNNWMKPIFNETNSEKFMFTENELKYYITIYKEIINPGMTSPDANQLA